MLGAFAATTVATMLFGSGIATASDPLVGKTLAEATSKMADWKATPVVASVFGSVLASDDCIVTSWHKSNFLDASGKKTGTANIYLNLNCNAALASPGTPGNSLNSPQGKLEKKNDETAVFVNTHPEYCQKKPTNCDWFCSHNQGKCTDWPL
jgi:hypothetical protein